MELRELVKIIRKNSIFLFAAMLGGFLLAILLTQKLPSGTKAQKLIFLVPKEENTSSTYRFDGYYSQEKARNFTDTAVAILENTALTQGTQGQTEIKKIAPQLIKITVSSTSTQEAQMALAKADELSRQKIEDLTNLSITTKALSQKPDIFAFSPSKKIYATAGMLLGLIFASLIIGLKDYFRL